MDQIRALQIAVDRLTADLKRTKQALGLLAGNTVAGATQRVPVTGLGPLAIGNIDVPITWPVSWPDQVYMVIPVIISGTAAIGSLNATLKADGSKNAAGCTITVANTGTGPVGPFALDVLGVRT